MSTIDKVVNGVKKGLVLMTLAAVAGCGSVAGAKETQRGYTIPDIESSTKVWTKYFDKDKDIPGKETKATLYYGDEGGRFATYEYKDKIFAIWVDHDRTRPGDYTLFDLNCDDQFETKEHSNYPILVPECLKSH